MKLGAQHQSSDKNAKHQGHGHAHESRNPFDQLREHRLDQTNRHEQGNGKHQHHGRAQRQRKKSHAEAPAADPGGHP